MFIIAKTSVPVYNKVFGTKIAPPEDVEFSYNKVIVMVAIIIGLLTAVTQYLKYKHTTGKLLLQKIALPTLVAALITTSLAIFYPITFYSKGAGFLGAIYVAFLQLLMLLWPIPYMVGFERQGQAYRRFGHPCRIRTHAGGHDHFFRK